MKIKSVDFAGAIGQRKQPQPAAATGLPQIAFAGRSNVGKSSLINRVLGRTRTPIARVSQQPGKTQEINFFIVRADPAPFCLVDLPGYGYARVPKEVRERWQPLIDDFLQSSTELRGVVQLLDIRHNPTADDRRAIDYLAQISLPVLLVLTKADKLGRTRRHEAVEKITQRIGADPAQVIPFSALNGDGRDEVLDALEALIRE